MVFQQIDILEHRLKCQNHSKSKNEIKTKNDHKNLKRQRKQWKPKHTTNSCPSILNLLSRRNARRTPSADSNSQNPNPLGVPSVGS